jgi:hypothetical protein
MNKKLSALAVPTLILTMLSLAACGALAGTTSTASDSMLLPMAVDVSSPTPCLTCGQATLSALQTQEKSDADAQAAATAAIMRANAQATLNSSSATLSAAQTQEQGNANIIAAAAAATDAIVRANAQATLVAAGSTQGAALTQDAIRQTQAQDSLLVTAVQSTQNAIGTVTQQNNNILANSTQTAVANNIATQTQAAVATSQWYADQARQRDEQRQEPLTLLWLWCPPIFLIAIALVCLFFFGRWMKIRETQQRLEIQSEPIVEIKPEPRPLREVSNNQYPLANPTDHVHGWLDEVKRNLASDEDDKNDNPDN